MKKKLAKPSLVSVRLHREQDCDPDLSYLGEYTSSPGYKEMDKAIDRQERGDMGRNEFRYFVPYMTDSPEQDYQRMEAYNRGAWCMVGVYASAEVNVNGTTQTVRTGGLWGIESDSDRDYFREVEGEELAELADILAALGVRVTVKRLEKLATRDD